ncbi:MAG: leucyl/phenylalanyl-tRNA--protein transferase [Planctomycetes bacterium]|nr:leucyl/phenylalanyl-tRNA--protein transferase [Planctomycetota bacterium]
MRGGAPRSPLVLKRTSPARFPDPREFDAEGLVAIGGDLSQKRLLAAYRGGIFPWYDVGYPPLWWSPDPRAVLDPDHLHVGRSLRRVLAAADFELGWNQCFERVMGECGRRRADGTWITPEMIAAYSRLHRAGHVHSLEVFRGGELVGGIYGVQVGALFAAESMFHRATDMSKVALVAMVRSLFAAGIELFDVQFRTGHLERCGVFELSRADYLAALSRVTEKVVDLTALVPGVT